MARRSAIAIETSIEASEGAGPGEDEDPQDLLGRVRRGADRVRAEDRERLDLGQPLADLLVDRQRPPEQDRADLRERPAGRRPRRGGGLAGNELALVGVAEERGMRSVDPDPAVAELAAAHARRGSRRRRGAAVSRFWCSTPRACAAAPRGQRLGGASPGLRFVSGFGGPGPRTR